LHQAGWRKVVAACVDSATLAGPVAPVSTLAQDGALQSMGPPMPNKHSRPTPQPHDSRPWVVKLQILAAVLVPMLGLGLWLRSQGFW
jgi:hypothetical protein